MNYRAAIRPRALAQWSDALARYLEISENAGENFNTSVQQSVERICERPLAYPSVLNEVRSIRIEHFPYRLYYRVVGDSVIIHLIFHMSRDPAKLRRYLGRINE